MDINGREKAKRFWIVASLLGICMFVTAIFCFFHTEKNEAEKRMVEIVNYVKVQCSTYTHYNESSESKSLLRAIESARQMSTNIDMEVKNRKQLDRKFLKENLQSLWVDGILVLDEEGKKDLIQNGLSEEMDHVSISQPAPEKMPQGSLQFTITHLRDLSEIIL